MASEASLELYNRMKKTPFILAGPCAIESEEHGMETARVLKEVQSNLKRDGFEVIIVFKSSFDKANRSKAASFRGLGLEKTLEIMKKIKETFGFPLVTDVHETQQIETVAKVCDIVQIPAFLCRQTDLVVEAAKTGKIVFIKKGQWLGPQNLWQCGRKAHDQGNPCVILGDRGTQMGMNDMVFDPRNPVWLRGPNADAGQENTEFLSLVDCTHMTQYVEPSGEKTNARREFVPTYARVAAAAGAQGFFFEVHPNPEKALSDGPCVWYLDRFEPLLREVLAIRAASTALNDPYMDKLSVCKSDKILETTKEVVLEVQEESNFVRSDFEQNTKEIELTKSSISELGVAIPAC